jgi:ribulose-phosphate 3-epimerase
MVTDPQKYFESFARSGASLMSIHVEAVPHLHRQLYRIRELGCQAGVVINPATPVAAVTEVVADIDLLLVMSVNPGFSAQEFIPGSVAKVGRARQLLDEWGSRAALEVDGGISRETIGAVWRAGADTFVAGNAIFGAKDPAAEIAALRDCCTQVA